MANREVYIHVERDEENKLLYKWRVAHQQKPTVDCMRFMLFPILIKDIYRDKIPEQNITMSRELRSEFETYKSTHLSEIEFALQEPQKIWEVSNIDYSQF